MTSSSQLEEPQRILVLGTTAYAEVFIDMFEDLPHIRFSGCVENLDRSRCSLTVAGLPVLWNDDIEPYRESHRLICVLATTRRKDWIENLRQRGFRFVTLVHGTAHVSRRTELGDGVSIDAGTVVAGFTQISEHVRIGRQVSIGHHTGIGSFATIHPGSVISGNCSIGREVTIGTGAVVIDGISIGAGATIAAGSVVTRNVPAGALFAGNPGRVVRPDYPPQ